MVTLKKIGETSPTTSSGTVTLKRIQAEAPSVPQPVGNSGVTLTKAETPKQEQPTITQRLVNILTGAAKSTGAGVTNVANTFEQLSAGLAGKVNSVLPDSMKRTEFEQGANELADKYAATADKLAQQSAQSVANAKQGLGKVGSTLVDVGVAGTQMLGDAAVNLAAPGAGLAALGTRAFGNAAQEARQRGATLAQQIGYGAAVGGIEVLTEKMFDGLAGIYGKGAADDVIEGVIKKLAKTGGGQNALRVLSSAAGEGFEEIVAGLTEPAMQAIFDKQSIASHYDKSTLTDALHDAIVGGILGGLGGGIGTVRASAAAKAQNNAPNGVGARMGATEGNLTGKEKMPTAAVNEATEGIIVPPAQNAEVQATVERGRSDRPLGNNATQEGVATDDIVAQNERMSSDRLLEILLGNRGMDDGLGGADIGTLNTSFENMQAQSDEFHPINENAAQREAENLGRAPEEVPTVNPTTGQNISKTVSTILNSEITSNEMAPILEQAVANGQFDYIPVTDKDAMARAQQTMQMLGGYKSAATDFIAKARFGKTTKNDFALGVACYNEAVAAGDAVTAFQLADAIGEVAHTSAQTVQAVNLFNRLTPAGKLLTLKNHLRRVNANRASSEKTGRATEYADKLDALEAGRPDLALDLDADLATAYLMAETDEARAAAWQDIINDIASKMPPTAAEKWNYWRYTAMLTNPVTHVRNTVGNTVQAGLRRLKNAVGAAMERALPQEKRTKAMLTNSEADTALKNYARELYEQDRNAAMGTGKYSETSASGIAREIRDARKMFGQKYAVGKAVQKIGDVNTAALEAEDLIFNRGAYVDSLAQALKAKGITYEMAVDGQHDAAVNEARSYAISEAAKATYRDSNAFSNFVSNLGKTGCKPADALVDALLPFRRTPANILVRGTVDYSPLALGKAFAQVRSGADAAAVVDTLASGLTGTGVLALGAYLTAEGLLHIKAGGDDREEDFLKASGYQDFAIQVGDTSYTLDWLVPAAMPLFAGCAMMNGWEESGGAFADFLSAMGSISDVVLETSMLQSVNSMIENMSYAKSPFWFTISSALTSYLSQAVPTIGGKVASAMDDTARKAYTQGGRSDAETDASYFVQSILRKVPKGRETLQPSIDLWGREISNGGAAERFAEAFVSPGFFSAADTSAVTQELQRLAGSAGSTVYPSKAARSFTVNGATKYLTADEYTEFAKNVGQTRYGILDTLLGDKRYKSLSDADKADVIADVYEYASAKAKSDISEYEPTSWVQKAMDSGNAAEYILTRKQESDAAAAAKEEKAAAWEKTLTSLKPYGVTQKVLDDADKDGSGNVKQAELDAYLKTRGDLDAATKQMIWNSVGGWKTSYADYTKKHK